MAITVRQAAVAFESYCQSLGLAESYVRTQGEYADRFAKCCDEVASSLGNRPPLRVDKLTPQYVARFYQGLPDTRASHNRALSALRQFMKFLERMEYIGRGQGDWLLGDRKTKKFTRQPKYYIPVSQFGPMLDAAERRHPVERMTLALAFYTLGRQGEIAGLRLKDVNLTEGTIRVYRPKRKRWTVVQICPELREELAWWLNLYSQSVNIWHWEVMIKHHPDWFLVPALDCIKGRTGGAYDAAKTAYRLAPERQAQRLEKLVKRMLDIFGAQTEDGRKVRHLGEGMHTIRRSGARAMIDYLATVWGEDKALLMVSTMLDHETTTMTLLYIGRNLEQKRLNAYLAGHSMYGDHGRAESLGANVTRLPLGGPEGNAEGYWPLGDSGTRVGEVDAL